MNRGSGVPPFRRPEVRSDALIRLICLPHGGGGASAYHDWAAHLPPEIELLAYHPPGRGPRRSEAAHEDMASAVAALLAALGPYLDRPIALFGHSVGAAIAVAAAQALEAGGRAALLRVFASGHAAPTQSPRPGAANATMAHLATDDALWAQVAELGLTAELAAADAALREIALPAIRADFKISELWRPDATPPLRAPLSVLAGADDPIAPAASMAGWDAFASAPVERLIFPGGHFFTQSARDDVLDALARRQISLQ
ncbi:MAG: alpha/beta fold hydrolase, partial [Pseudomonadota bacterium]